ncbi:MAG TPA: histidinol-phosphate transaminase [Luteimonas sp.]|nr:histidinol-phosphate transaminase [Luteimonas sp.]
MNASSTGVLREDLRDFAGYASARQQAVDAAIRLDANESPWPSAADVPAGLRCYPEPQPRALATALAQLHGVAPERVLATRGSDEGIDLLLRATCAPGRGAIVTTPPTFGMYAVCARLHGARVLEVPLLDGGDGFRVDLAAVGDAVLASGARLVFLCSPGNPTGDVVPLAGIAALARRLAGSALVVVDEAYGEYAGVVSAASLPEAADNIVVLRTLSKAHALAGARVGCVIAPPPIVAALRRCQAPYPLPAPSVAAALSALAPGALARTQARVRRIRVARDRLAARLRTLPAVRRVDASGGNFLLLRLVDADAAIARLRTAGIAVRDMRAVPALADAVRATVGTARQNAALFDALAQSGEGA